MDRKKKIDAVALSRKWREAVSREIADMTPSQMVAYFKPYTSADILLPKSRRGKHSESHQRVSHKAA